MSSETNISLSDQIRMQCSPGGKCSHHAPVVCAFNRKVADELDAQAAEIERLREALEPFAQCAEAWREKYLDSEPLIEGFPEMPETPTQLRVGHLVNAATALQGREKNATEVSTPRREVKSTIEILRRLAAGDRIVFSRDGDEAWFAEGDRAFVRNVLIEMRSKGYLKRMCSDAENYRGFGEYDTISEAGLAFLEKNDG